MNNGCKHTPKNKKSQTQISILWLFLFACGTSKASGQQVANKCWQFCQQGSVKSANWQQNAAKSATKALSSYFGNWLASQFPNLTWPLGLACLTNLKTISKWHLHICFSACSSPCTMHMNNVCKPTPQNKKSQTQISFFCLFLFACGTLKASGQQVASKILAILPPRLCQVTLATDWPANSLI